LLSDQIVDDMKPEACSVLSVGGEERLEDLGQDVPGNSLSVVPVGEHQLFTLGCGLQTDLQLTGLSQSVSDGVDYQIGDDLGEGPGIAIQLKIVLDGEDDLDQALGLLQTVKEEIHAESIEYQRNCCAVSIYGPHFSERPAIAGNMFAATAEAGIDLHMISTSISTVSCVINEDQFDAALAKLRERFLVP